MRLKSGLALSTAVLLILGFLKVLTAGSEFRRGMNQVRAPSSVSLPQSPAFESTETPDFDRLKIFHFSRKIASQFVGRGQSKDGFQLKEEGTVTLLPAFDSEKRQWSKVVLNLDLDQGRIQLSSTFPVWARFDSAQHLIELKARKPLSAAEKEELNFIRDWVSLYAFHDSQDAMGRYRAKFSLGRRSEIKIKERYLGPMGDQREILKSRHLIFYDPKGVMQRMRGEERIRFPFSGNWKLETESSYQIELTEDHPMNPERIPRFQSESVSISLDEVIPRPQKSWLQIKSNFVGSDLKSHGERLRVFHEVLGALREEPGRIAEFKGSAEEIRSDAHKFQVAIGVLANLESDGAQECLREWYRSESDRPEIRSAVLNALVLTPVRIPDATIAFLKSLSSTEEAAIYALGSSLRGVSRPEVQNFLNELDLRAQNEAEHQVVLDAVGNSRDPAMIPILERAWNSGSTSLREAAILATRFMPQEQVAPLIQRARIDSEESVREAVNRSLRAQALDPLFFKGN
jgi:hypothetical protein